MYTDPSGHAIVLTTMLIVGSIVALIGFGGTVLADYGDDGEVFNGSISGWSYALNTVVGFTAGFFGAYAWPAISGFLSSSFTFAMPVLAGGGGVVAVSVTGAQIATGAATLGLGIMLFAKDPYVKHLEKGMSQNQKEHFQREIEDLKRAEGRGGKDNLIKELLKQIAEEIKKIYK